MFRNEKRNQSHSDTQPLHSTLLPFTLSENIKVGRCWSWITERGTQKRSPFKLNIKLAFMRTSSTVTDMNNALHSGVIGLICTSNLKHKSFMGCFFFSFPEHTLFYKSLMQPHMHPLCIWFAHIFINNWTTVLLVLVLVLLLLKNLHTFIIKDKKIKYVLLTPQL